MSLMFWRALALCSLFASPCMAQDCLLTKASYAPLDADDDMSAEEGQKNDYVVTHVTRAIAGSDAPYVVRITERRQKLAYDFAVFQTQGHGGTRLIFAGKADAPHYQEKAGDPVASLIYFDANLKRMTLAAETNSQAPPYLIMPEMGAAFWNWRKGIRRFVPPDGIWKRTACQ